jgi:predicted RNA-binding Zn-ribbon protein involved in translation (DUF1610 family)
MRTKARQQSPNRQIEPLEPRRRKRAIEAPQAMKDYLRAQSAVREQMAMLRAARLAREAEATQDIHQPPCPNCGTAMFIVSIFPDDKPDHDRRSFECPDCKLALSRVVKFRQSRG